MPVTCKCKSAAAYVEAYKEILLFWAQYNVCPKTIRLDNELSTEVIQLLTGKNGIQLQTVPPGAHRANKAERAIQYAKNHIISTLATMPPGCPFYLWEDAIPQMEICINLMRPFPANPTISCYEGLY